MITTLVHATVIEVATCILCVVFALGGALALWAAITNADWFFETSSARSVSSLMSRGTARAVYGVAGVLILAMSVIIFLQ